MCFCYLFAGEDRWLCTLLLQQGYKVEYCAAADASTYAPETFREFFNQRRRWIPSTLANMMDLLSDYHRTVLVNDNISYLYMMYQAVVMGASLLAPATVILMVAGAIHVVVGGALYWLWLSASIGTALLYMLICFKAKADTQITVAGYMSTFYAILMLAVTVGIIVQTSQDSWTSPNALFIITISGIFVLAGLLHPEEFMCLFPGTLYFLCIPAGFLLLFIYSMINMNIVSWGTREIPKLEDLEKLREKEKEKKTNPVVRELKKIFMTLCCCIKTRCMYFIESRSNPTPPPKKDTIVQEIIAELGKLENGQLNPNGPNGPNGPPGPGIVTPGASNYGAPIRNNSQTELLSRQGSSSDYNRDYNFRPDYERQNSTTSNYGRPQGITNSLLEERQKSIVRQLDSIQTGKDYERSNRSDYESTNKEYERSNRQGPLDKYKDSESLVYGQNNRENDPYYSCIQNEPKIQRDDMVNPYWITEREVGRGPVRYLDQNETKFWQKLIDKYLYPIDHDEVHEAKIKMDLRTLRNNAAFLFFMLNFLWLFIIFLLQVGVKLYHARFAFKLH